METNKKPIILTDSSADLKDEMYKEIGVERLSLSYTIDGEEFFDNSLDADTKAFYDKMRAGKIPLTSQINTQTFFDHFEKMVPLGRPIIYIGFSSKLSATYSSGAKAVEMILEKYPDTVITAIDTKCASGGQGLLPFYAAQMRDEGKSYEEIVAWIEENKYRAHHWVFVDDLNYLKRGGRLSAAEAFFGNILSIKPLIWMDAEGKLTPYAKERGKKKVLKAMVDRIAENIEDAENQTVFICHSDYPEGAKELKAMIEERVKLSDVRYNYIGTVIGSHTGPGILALFFMGKDRRNITAQ